MREGSRRGGAFSESFRAGSAKPLHSCHGACQLRHACGGDGGIGDLEKETQFHGAGGFAFVYAGLGERQRVFACLEKSYEDRDVFLAFLGILPEFRSLHGDPRFTDLLGRIGLPARPPGAAAGPAAR